LLRRRSLPAPPSGHVSPANKAATGIQKLQSDISFFPDFTPKDKRFILYAAKHFPLSIVYLLDIYVSYARKELHLPADVHLKVRFYIFWNCFYFVGPPDFK
jgi:hypothetical protein